MSVVHEQVLATNDRQEGPDDFGVELTARVGENLVQCLFLFHGITIRAVRSHSIPGVGHCDDAGHDRYLVAEEPRWVSGTVEALVVVQDCLTGIGKEVELL